MRIAYIVSLFPKLSETFILRELVELRRRGHEVIIVSLKREREATVHEAALDLIPLTLYPAVSFSAAISALHFLIRKPIALAAILWHVVADHARHPVLMMKSLALVPEALHVAKQLASRRVDHVHAHWASYPAQVAWIVRRLNGVPYSVTGHAHDLFLPNPMLPRKLREAAFFATISEYNRALLIQKCGPSALEKVRVIRCGLPLAEFPFLAERRRAPAADLPELVSVGRLVDYKGFDVLIRACDRLRLEGRTVRCVIVGEGPERPRLERLVAALSLGGVVTLAGVQRGREVAETIARADLFVLACVTAPDGQQDGIPIVLMEAMAMGVPVVSTRLSGIPELVVDNGTGLLVEPGDPDHLAGAVQRLLSDPDLAERLRRAGRDLVVRQFDLAHSMTQLCAEFARSAAGASRSQAGLQGEAHP